MATAVATQDPVVTVKQHGFVVRDPSTSAYSAPSPLVTSPAEALWVEESIAAGGSSGLTRAALGLLPRGSSSGAIPCGVSPGLPKAGDVRPAEYTHLTPGVKRLMRSVMRGLKAHQDPEAALEGLGGTYFFRNEAGSKIAIMKPCDEEPLAPNNPKGFVGRALGEPGLKPTVRVGEAASREVAAYLLDHDRFARVPHTVMVRMSHPVFHVAQQQASTDDCNDDCNNAVDPGEDALPEEEEETSPDGLPLKLGSLQEFVPHECDTSELGASRFCVRDVQRIGILDLRLFNTDRHAGNMLVRRARHGSSAPEVCLTKDQYELIPIDHGFALPEALEPPYFEWQHWPQAMMPFGQEELDYIANLDPRADAEMLRRELPGLREESLRLLEVATTLLKRCAAAGLSLSEIAGVVSRPLVGLEDEPSELEQLCEAARREVDEAIAADAAALQSGEEEEEEDDENDEDALSDLIEEDEDALLHEAIDDLLIHGDAGGDASMHNADEDGSPGAASASTHFEMPRMAGSDASRQTTTMDDALFCMDEDGTRTPLPGSPDVLLAPLGGALRKITVSRAPSLVVKRSGELATPGAIVGMSFGSALASAMDSLPASFDSGDSPKAMLLPVVDVDAHRQGSMESSTSTNNTAAAFRPSSTYMPSRGHSMFATAAKPPARPSKGTRARRRMHGGGRAGRKALLAQYPPLVEPRGRGSSSVFGGLTAMEWDQFMDALVRRIECKLRIGAWCQSAAGQGPVPQMSCPKF
jgi:hypothetical protein